METPRLLLTFAALILIFYTFYLANQSDYAERHYMQTCTRTPSCSDCTSLFSAIATGTECTYKWFPPEEVCIILERFGAVDFVGDEIAGSAYEGFELLLSTGVGVRKGKRVAKDECDCVESVLRSECLGHKLKDVAFTDNIDPKTFRPLCKKLPHNYIPLTAISSLNSTTSRFKTLTYSRSRSWQPFPLILSFTHGSNLDVALTTAVLDEWQSLATKAERNIPLLFLGPLATNSSIGLERSKEFEKEIVDAARERHFEVLSLYNLTSVISDGVAEKDWEKRMAVAVAMVVINWLSMLETS